MMEEKSFEELLLENDTKMLKKGKIFSGKVIEIATDGIWVSLDNTNGDVFVKRDDLCKELSDYKIGEETTVRVTKTNDEEGMNWASEKAAIVDKVRAEVKEGVIVKGKFTSRLDKGYEVLIDNVVRAFLPGSLSTLRPEDGMPKEMVDFKVISVKGRNITLSRKDFVNEIYNKVFAELKENMVVEGIIESIMDFGAFVKLNDYVTALLPRSEVSWDKNVDLKNTLKIGQKVKGIIIKSDAENRKISLSLKQLKDDPWSTIEEKYSEGRIVSGRIIQILPFGFAVKFEQGVEGLVHESEIFWVKKEKISDKFKVDQDVTVKILGVDRDNRRLSLSYRQVQEDPWTNVESRYPEGTVVNGKVEKIIPNGIIVDFGAGLTGFVHVSELSWNFVDNVEETFKEGQTVKARILNFDHENRKIKLSIKQAIDNPWKKVSDNLKKGDVVKCKAVRYAGTGVVTLVEGYEIEAFLPLKKATMERNDDIKAVVELGSTFDAKIIDIEFENEDKKGNMVVSITDLLRDKENAEARKVMEELNNQ